MPPSRRNGGGEPADTSRDSPTGAARSTRASASGSESNRRQPRTRFSPYARPRPERGRGSSVGTGAGAEGEDKGDEGGEGASQTEAEDFGDWKPSLAIGAPLALPGEDLSKLQLAIRNVAAWRARGEYYGWTSEFTRQHSEAVNKRYRLNEFDDEDTMPLSELPSFRQAAVAERLELLRDVLSTSVALAEQENIRAAITGYDDGAIPYSAAWTLIYAGRIVDTCPTYSSFCLDRSARLDRYAAAHGPGFLWYEPPLQRASGDPNGDAELLAYKGTCLGNERGRRHDSYGMGHWDVHMGFRRRNEFTSRTLTPREGRILAASDFRKATAPDTEAKTVFFEMLADSGATLPVLDSGDLALLGIQRGKYAAQSAQSVATAGGSKNGFIYEMDCGIYAGANEGETLVTADKDIWPAEPQVLGGTIPVLVLERVKTRLSGMLMWHVCYTSSAPGTFKCWIGEDRMEVLGAGRMPGQMRWSGWKHDDDTVVRSRGTLKTGNPPWMTSDLGTPTRVMFLHEGPSTQRDSEDDSEHTSDAGGKNDSETDPNTGTGGEGDVSNKKVMDNQQAKGKSSIWRVPQEMDWGHAVTGMPGVERWIIEPRASASQQRALARQREAVERKKKNGPGKESSGKQGNVAWKLWNYMSP